MGLDGKYRQLVSFIAVACRKPGYRQTLALTGVLALLLLPGCAGQSSSFELLDQDAMQANEIRVVVTPHSSNRCWTNSVELAKAAAHNLSAVYGEVSIATFDEADADGRLVFQVSGWAYRRGGICLGNYRVSVGQGLEVKNNGYIDTVSPSVTPKRKAILGSPAQMNSVLLSYVDEVSRQLAEQIATMR